MRLGIARIAQETNTFSPILTDLDTVRAHGVARGQRVLKEISPGSNIPGFLDIVGSEELFGIISAHARPAGPLTPEAMQTLLGWFAEDLRKALPLDALLTDLHGAFAGVADPDVEGLFLAKAREILGEEAVIGASMDLHAHITRRKIENVDIIRGYHTHPHVDGRETARRVAQMVVAAVRGEVRPVVSAVKIPMITPAKTQLTEEYPMRALIEETRAQERDERVLSSSIFAVQPWLDVPELGWSTVVVTDGDQELAEQLARDLAQMAWNQREAYVQPVPSYADALEQAFAMDAQPVVISDFADMMTGGGTGDSTWYLKDLLSRKPQEPCYLTIVDPEAIHRMADAGEGSEVTLALGGKQDSVHSSPVTVTGKVARILPACPGRELPQSVGMVGVLKIGEVYVVVCERLGPGSDPIIYSALGLDPAEAKILVVKSIVDFREGYKDFADRFLFGEAPGLCPSDLTSLRWELAPRPLFPLDRLVKWDSAAATVYHSGT